MWTSFWFEKGSEAELLYKMCLHILTSNKK